MSLLNSLGSLAPQQIFTSGALPALKCDVSGCFWNNSLLTSKLAAATWETVLTTFWSTLLAGGAGLLLGLVLVAYAPGGLLRRGRAAGMLYSGLSFVVNFGRSVPYVILFFALVSLTRILVGTALGWQAAVPSLAISATPFFARLVEANLLGVDEGKIEAAKMSGASTWQIMFGVQVREALPQLILSLTNTCITIIAYSTMAGVLGTGGIGALAMNYGYTRQMTDVTIVTVIVIYLLIQVVQMSGNMLSRLVDHR